MSTRSRYERELSIARSIAKEAGQLIASRWDTPISIQHKGTIDLVSEIDLASEALIIDRIRTSFPDDHICAEESSLDLHGLSVGRVWCIDPLDGTTNFSHGFPHFCVSIALLIDGAPVVAVVYDPLRQWSFFATRGGGAWRNDQPLQVTQQTQLSQALIATGFPYDRRESPLNNFDQATRALLQIQGLRRAGAAALDLAYVAAGWLDGYWEFKLKPWDVAAGGLLVTEAGGLLSDERGTQEWLKRGIVVCAGTSTLHQSLCGLVQ